MVEDMLYLFKIKNYTSFKTESILDLRATSYTQHMSHIISEDNCSVLKTTAIYGANASGKSNFISAMFFFKNYILSQFISKNANQSIDAPTKGYEIWDPFKLSAKNDEPSEFEIVFSKNGKQIQYGFECKEKTIISEWYYINNKKVFERSSDATLSFGKDYKLKLQLYNKIPSERLYMSILEYFLEDSEKEEVLGDFISFFVDDFNVFSEILFESTVKRIAGSAIINKKLIENSKYRKTVSDYLAKIDIGIKGLSVAERVIKDENGKIHKQKTIRTIHNVYNEDGKKVDTVSFDLSQESSGTLRFLAYIQSVVDMIENGGVFIVDEMSARLHPLLTKLIIDIFQSGSNSKAQLIFTTHDISLLNHDQFRRDEVVFVDKNEKGESSLYALSDLKVREDASFSKDYLQGKYGAIPIFDYKSILGGSGNE